MSHGFRDLLMGKPVVVLGGEAKASEAAREMRELGESLVAVVGENGVITGVLTPKDLVFRVMAEGRDPKRTTLADIQTPDPVCADLDGPPERAAELLFKEGYSQLPLLMEGLPCGRLEARELRVLQDRAIEFLSSAAEEDRLDAMHFLASTGGSTALFAFTQALRDKSAAVRELAVEGLLKDGTPEASIAVLPFLRDEDTVVRNCAIEVLSEIGAKALGQICGLADDPDDDVQIFVMNILGNIGHAGGLPTVLKMVENPEVRVRQAAVVAAGQIGGEEATIPLKRCVEDEDEWVRMSAVEALAAIGGRAATMALREALGTADESLFLAIVEALGEMGDEDAVETIIRRSAMLSPGPAMVVVTSLAERWGVEVIEQVPMGFRRRALEGLVNTALASTLLDLELEELQLTLALEEERVVEHLLREPLGLSADDPHISALVAGVARPGYLPVLQRHLENRGPNQDLVFQALLRMRHQEAEALVVAHFESLPAFLRVQAFETLDPDTPGLVDVAIRAVEEGGEEREAAAGLLSRNLGPQAVDFLAGLLDRENLEEGLLGLAAQAVCELAVAGGRAVESHHLAQDPRGAVRRAALTVLGSGLPLPVLQEALTDGDPETVAVAIGVLADKDPTLALQALRDQVAEGEPEILPSVFETLAGLDLEEAGAILGDYATEGEDDWCRFQAVQGWARFSGAAGLVRFEEWLASGDPILEAATANALLTMGLPEATALLAAQAEHGNDEVRMFACQAGGGAE